MDYTSAKIMDLWIIIIYILGKCYIIIYLQIGNP